MLVILEAASGPVLGRRIEIGGGSILRIGRTGKSDYAIAEDGYLSSLHFSVECDGTECRVRDLGSSNGTFVNGSRITDQIVGEGDSLVAGGSTFRIHVDLLPSITGVGMPRVSTAPTAILAGRQIPEDSGYSPAESALLSELYSSGEQVFAVLDAARDSRIPTFLDSSGETYLSLDVAGRTGVFAVALPAESRLMHVLIKDGWGHGWGFFGTTKGVLENVAAHFASFVNMHNSKGAAITLCLWDPRVLRALLPAMPPEEADRFLGPCERIIFEGDKAEAEKPVMAVELARSARGPRHRSVVLP